ncbi:hypothetical protein DRE_03260 [Drechslerella stenobrocha 248]|uniref:Uncharacterized protein n=1 Tax=Drechslerella stenobrocha 248 TaxID=1043628 RepID=W7IF14_9PEZI|nr:hypothetical protein DRE_03260 [Drechslerella stenobrocha 248]
MSHPSLFFSTTSGRFDRASESRKTAASTTTTTTTAAGDSTASPRQPLSQDEARVKRIEAYAVFKRQDPALEAAVELLKGMKQKQRQQVKELVEAIIQSGGSGRMMRDAKHDGLVKDALGHLCIDRVRSNGEGRKGAMTGDSDGGGGGSGEWSEDTRMWEMKKFAGLMFYALKVVDGEVLEHTETIPDYLLRKSKQRTVVSTYTPDGRDLRSNIEKYTPQIFNASNWSKIAPLMWLIQPKYSSTRDDTTQPSTPSAPFPSPCTSRSSSLPASPAEAQPKYLRPKIIAIEIPGETYLLYRFFPFHNIAYERFLRSIASLPEADGTQLTNRQMMALMDAEEQPGGLDPIAANRMVMAWAGDVRNGSLAGEVRFALACCERGVEVCTTIQEAGWLALWGDHGEGEYGFRIAEASWVAEDELLHFLRPEQPAVKDRQWRARKMQESMAQRWWADVAGTSGGPGSDLVENELHEVEIYSRLTESACDAMRQEVARHQEEWTNDMRGANRTADEAAVRQRHRIFRVKMLGFLDRDEYLQWLEAKGCLDVVAVAS